MIKKLTLPPLFTAAADPFGPLGMPFLSHARGLEAQQLSPVLSVAKQDARGSAAVPEVSAALSTQPLKSGQTPPVKKATFDQYIPPFLPDQVLLPGGFLLGTYLASLGAADAALIEGAKALTDPVYPPLQNLALFALYVTVLHLGIFNAVLPERARNYLATHPRLAWIERGMKKIEDGTFGLAGGLNGVLARVGQALPQEIKPLARARERLSASRFHLVKGLSAMIPKSVGELVNNLGFLAGSGLFFAGMLHLVPPPDMGSFWAAFPYMLAMAIPVYSIPFRSTLPNMYKTGMINAAGFLFSASTGMLISPSMTQAQKMPIDFSLRMGVILMLAYGISKVSSLLEKRDQAAGLAKVA